MVKDLTPEFRFVFTVMLITMAQIVIRIVLRGMTAVDTIGAMTQQETKSV